LIGIEQGLKTSIHFQSAKYIWTEYIAKKVIITMHVLIVTVPGYFENFCIYSVLLGSKNFD